MYLTRISLKFYKINSNLGTFSFFSIENNKNYIFITRGDMINAYFDRENMK